MRMTDSLAQALRIAIAALALATLLSPCASIVRASSAYTVDTDLNLTVDVDGASLDAAIKAIRPDSPLIGLGGAMVAVGREYGINAIYIAAHAAWESAWGTSTIARDKNNLFGYGAYDDCPYSCALSFTTKEECIAEAMARIKADYLTPGGRYFKGATLRGMNVSYATDESWMNGVASIMNSLAAHIPDSGGEPPAAAPATAEPPTATPIPPTATPTPPPATAVPTPPSPAPGAPFAPTVALEQARQVVELLNRARTSAGQAELSFDPALARAAQAYSADMAGRDRFSEIGADGSTAGQRAAEAGLGPTTGLAELIAAGQPTAEEVTSAWLADARLRERILDPRLTMAGVGYAYNERAAYRHYWALSLAGRGLAPGTPVSPASSGRVVGLGQCLPELPRWVAFSRVE